MIEIKKILGEAWKNASISLWSIVLTLSLNTHISTFLKRIFIVLKISSRTSSIAATVIPTILITLLATLIYASLLFVLHKLRANVGISVYKEKDTLKSSKCRLGFAGQDNSTQILAYDLNFNAGNPVSFWAIKKLRLGILLRFNPSSLILSDADEDPEQKQNREKIKKCWYSKLFIYIIEAPKLIIYIRDSEHGK